MPVHFRTKLFSRSAFTLVELMVAMAIIILMLSIMSQAFVIATGAMQGLKEACDMHEKMRPVITLLQRDLGALHFDGSRKLSDSNFWDSGPPKEGYFMLWQDSANDSAEGVFNYVSFSRSSARANHMLAFSVKLPAKTPDDFFQTSIANLGGAFGNIFYNVSNSPSQVTDTPRSMVDANARRFETNSTIIKSDWAEVAYFLGPLTTTGDGSTDGKTGPSLPYFNLYRQQKLVLPSFNISGVILPVATAAMREEISCELSTGTFNKPSDLTVPWKRMGNRNFNLLGNRIGPLFSEFVNPSAKVNTDIIATNVISFDVRILTDDNRYDYEDLATILSQPAYSAYQPVYNYGTPPNSPPIIRVFDTWTTDQGSPTNPLKYDLGDWNSNPGKYQPSVTYNSMTGMWSSTTGNNASLIPVWNESAKTGLNIKSVQISIRIWDQKSNSAKMFVIVQKL